MLRAAEGAQTKENILGYGQYGSGKSSAWVTIAQMYVNTGTPGHFHIISTEFERAEVMLEAYPDVQEISTLHATVDYDSLLDAAVKVRSAGSPEDWVVLDSAGNAQLWVRDAWFAANRKGLSWREFQAEGGTSKDISPSEWIQMDQMHREILVSNIVRFSGHRYVVAQSEAVTVEGAWADKGAVKDLFGRVGVKPVGHKELGFVAHTVLHFGNPARGEYIVSTVKDKPGRGYLEREPLAPLPLGFTVSYLKGVAGWQL